MYNAGIILRTGDLVDPSSARFSQIFRRVVLVMGLSRSLTQVDIMEDHLILLPLLQVLFFEQLKISITPIGFSFPNKSQKWHEESSLHLTCF